MIKGNKEEVADVKEVEVEPMEKVVDLMVQCKAKDGKMNLLKEVSTLEVAILVTLGIIIVEKEKRDLSLKVLVTNVVKKDIGPLNVLTLEKILEVITKIL